MSGFFLFNDSFYPLDEEVLGPDNRGFRYGDGLFETMRLRKEEIPLLNLHLERLFYGLNELQFEIPQHFTKQFLEEQIFRLARKNQCLKEARVRLTVFRGSGGLFNIENNKPNYLIETYPLNDYFKFNQEGLQIDLCTEIRKSRDRYSNLKSSNYLPYVIAALYAQKNKLDEALVLNTENRVADGTISNIFWVKEANVFTPTLTEGPVAGVMRQWLLLSGKKEFNLNFVEKELYPEELWEADEVFLTNAVRGVRWVKRYKRKFYKNDLVLDLAGKLYKLLE